MIAAVILILMGIYLACGLVFAVPFVCWGVKKVDPHAAHGSWGFRVLIIPGTTAFWPLLLRRCSKAFPHHRRKAPPIAGLPKGARHDSPLLQRHRRIVIALGILLPVAFAAGIAVRKPVPVMAALPAILATAPQKFETMLWERTGLFAKAPVTLQMRREQKGAGKFAVTLSATRDFIKPDLLVYWVSDTTPLTDTLPANAILLGTFDATALPLPDAAAKAPGELVLYSLADNEIVDVSKPIVLSDSAR